MYGLDFWPQLHAKSENSCLEVCHDSPMGELKLVTKKFHCELAALHHLVSLVTLAVIHSLCSVFLYGCQSSVLQARLSEIFQFNYVVDVC